MALVTFQALSSHWRWRLPYRTAQIGNIPPSQTVSPARGRHADAGPLRPGFLPSGTAWPGCRSGTSSRTSRTPTSTTCCWRTSSSGPITRSRWPPTTAPGWVSTAAKSPSGHCREVGMPSSRVGSGACGEEEEVGGEHDEGRGCRGTGTFCKGSHELDCKTAYV